MRFPPPLYLTNIRPRFFSSPSGATASSSQYPYLVPRNSRGSLPVYSDVRNGGSRCLISIRNVEGNIKVCDPIPHDRSPSHHTPKVLADELLRDLSDPSLIGSTRINARITRSNHLVLSGIRRKQVVLDWLARHGF